jgi:hypothetical protein
MGNYRDRLVWASTGVVYSSMGLYTGRLVRAGMRASMGYNRGWLEWVRTGVGQCELVQE